MKALLVALLALISGSQARPAIQSVPSPQVPVHVLLGNDNADPTGRTLVYEVREELRRSAAFTLSDQRTSRVTVSIITLDVGCGNSSATAASVLTTTSGERPVVIDHTIHVVGSLRTSEVAKEIVADLDEHIEAIGSESV